VSSMQYSRFHMAGGGKMAARPLPHQAPPLKRTCHVEVGTLDDSLRRRPGSPTRRARVRPVRVANTSSTSGAAAAQQQSDRRQHQVSPDPPTPEAVVSMHVRLY
jgi:hypothetical protein